MAMKWSDVAANPAFQALSFDDQEEARNQYFNEVVAPQVSDEEIDVVRGAFLSETRLAPAPEPVVSRQELPVGMTPSTAGGGRGSINPPMIKPQDNRGIIQRVGDYLKPAPKSVMEGYIPTPEQQQADVDRRLSYGAGPISQQAAGQADLVRSGMAQPQSALVTRVAEGMDRVKAPSFGALAERAAAPVNIKAARDAKADEFRSAGEWAADTLSAFSQGTIGLVQIPINIISPSSDIAATLRATQKEMQAQESEVLKAQREQLRERVLSEDGFFDKYAATVVQLVTSPALGLSEAVKQVPNFLGIVGASRLVGAAAAGTVGLAGKASPTLALGEAISGGVIQAGARAAGTTAGGVGASMIMTGGDAAGGVYDKLTDPRQTPLSMWEQNPDYKQLIAGGKSSKDAIEEIATAKARMAALVTAPLGLLGFMGAEAAVASRGLGKATAEALTLAGAGKMLAKDLIGEQLEEGGTQFGGNVIARTVNPKQSLSEGVPEAMGTALVTSAPFSAVGAASQYQEARAAQTPDTAAERQAVGLFDPNSYDPSLVTPTQTTRSVADIGPSAPISFTPVGSVTQQAGLIDIVVPNAPEAIDVSTLGTVRAQPDLRGPAGSDQPGGGVGLPGRDAVGAGRLGGGDAGLLAADAGADVLAGSIGVQPTAGIALPRVTARATDQDLLARTEAAVATQENNNAVVQPAEMWVGRKGDGYITQADATQAIGGRQRMFPALDWKVEEMPSGKFRLAGYEQQGSQPAPSVGTTQVGAGVTQLPQVAPATTATPVAEPITAPSGAPFSTEKTAAVYAQQNGITGYSTVKTEGGWVITPQETNLGTQPTQSFNRQPAAAISGATGAGVLPSMELGSAAQTRGGENIGLGPVADSQNRKVVGPSGSAADTGTDSGLPSALRLAPPAPLSAVTRAVSAIKRISGVDSAVDTAPLNERQQAASAVARIMGRTVTFLKADAPGALPNGFMVPGDNANIFIANDTEDAPLAVAMHEIYHTLPERQRLALNKQLAQYFRQDRRTEFAKEFRYDASNTELLDEEIPAFMVQAISQRADFWQDLRTKMGNAEFAEVAKTILAKLNTIIGGAKEQYGDEFVNKYITDVAKARDLLSTAYAEAMQEQGMVPDATLTGDVMMARRAKTEKVGEFDMAVAKDGSITVYGDSEAIRAQIPENVQGRITKDGITFTNAAAPRVRAALEGRQVAYSRGGQVTEKLPMKDGKYLGAPEKFNTPGKIPTLRKILRQLADEGAPGRYWYENSGREVLKMVGGDVNEARKFVALLAIYSPQAKVDANSTFGLRAWAQYKAGQPISVKTGVMDKKAKAALDNVDEFWSGEKTGNFFFNLLREIDPTTEGKQGATIDMWMMRAGQYDTDAPSNTQYSFMENETNRLAQELGWEPQQVQAAIWVAMKARMENSGVKKMTEATSAKKGWIRYDYPIKNGKPFKTRVIIEAQKHRDNWLKHSFEHDVTKDDTQQAKFDFGDGLKRHIGQVSFEARPGRTSGALPGIHAAPYAQQVEFQQAVQKAFLNDNGTDELAAYLGLLIDSDILAPGVWQGEVSPSTQLGVAMAPAKGDEGKTNVDPAQAKALNIYAAVAGLVARQEGVGWHRPFYASTKRDANGLDISVGRVLNPREVADLETAVGKWMADNGKAGWQDQFAFVSSPSGIRIVNFGIITNDVLQSDIVRVAESVLPDFDYRVFASSGDMPTNNWKDNPNGESYVQRIRSEGRSDVLDWARTVLAPRVQRVFDEYAKQYGWGDAGKLSFSNRAGDGSRGQGTGGSPDRSVQTSERADAQTVGGLSASEALPGAPSVRGFTGPDPRLVAVAEQYARDTGITLRRQAEYVQIDPERATRIAQAYEVMPHAPQDLRVKAAFKELIAQTTAQYRALERAGYKFWFIDLNKADNAEYASSPWNAMRDIRANKVMGVFPTDEGFGSNAAFDPASNPLLEDTGIKWPSTSLFGPRKRVLANDLFRAVHDAFGHGLEGAGFRAQGEENAWQAHARLFTGAAVAAITSETRGQNSWLNYGPSGESNRTAKVEDTVFADQKTGLMPEWTWSEGRAGDMPDVMASNRLAPSTPEFKRWFGDSVLTSKDGTPQVLYHGTADDVTSFNLDHPNRKDTGWLGTGVYLTDNIDQAELYSMQKRRSGTAGENVMPIFARLTKPYMATMEDKARVRSKGRSGANDFTFKLKNQGYDGVILQQGEAREIVVFDTSAVKSAFNERPTERAELSMSNRAQIESPQFKKWFGDSKVVDGNGEPMVMYHGTNRSQGGDAFTQFDTYGASYGLMGLGSYFTREPMIASEYTRKGGGNSPTVYPVYLSIRNPLDMDAKADAAAWIDAFPDAEAFHEGGDTNESWYRAAEDAMQDERVPAYEGAEAMQAGIISMGYDGIKHIGGGRVNKTDGIRHRVFIAFDPEQIKSAIGNNGEFNSKNADIRRSNRATETPAFRKWFGNSKVTNESGQPLVVYHGTRADFATFEPSKRFGDSYFTSESVSYANTMAKDQFGKTDGGNVMPVFVSLQNPRVIKFAEYNADALEGAMSDGTVDGLIAVDESGVKQVIIAFRPTQLKSATGNNGDFDGANPNITASNRRQRLSTIGQNFTLPATNNRDLGRIKIQDDALRMKRVIEAVKAQGGTVGEAQNFYDANTLMPGRVQATMDDFRDNVMRPLIDKAVDFGIDMDELALYAYAKHAEERNAYIASINKRMPDGGSGMTNDHAQNILDLAKLSGDEAKFEELHKDLMAITATTRLVMLSEGLISQDEFDALDGAYANYIPLRGLENVDENTGAARPGVGRGINVRGGETIKALGRKSQASDLIENVIRDYQRVILRVEKNDVGKVLLDFVLSNPDPDLWGVDVERSKPSLNKATGLVQYTKNVEKGEDTIGVKVGGTQIYIKLADADFARAIRQAWKDETSGLERATLAMTGWWNNWMRNVLTRYNPAFAAINIPRDALWSGTAAALADLGPKGLGKYLANYGKALMASTRQEAGIGGTTNRIIGNPQMDRAFQEFRSAGGITGGFYMRSLDDINTDLRNEMLLAGAKAKNSFEAIKSLPPYRMATLTARMLEFMGSASENATRFALYQAARDVGKTPAQAALLAKNGTTNFNRKGEWGGALNNLYLFFNAGVQGTAQLLYVLKKPSVQASMAGVAGVGMMLALYGASAGGEDDDGEAYWDKIPSYVKERNMVFMLPPGDALADGIDRVGKRGRYFTLPVQYGFNIFPNAGYMMADVYRNAKDPKRGMTPTKAALHMTSTIFGSVNPFGGAIDFSDGVQVLLAAMPTLVDLPIQLVNERNTFGSPSSPEKSSFDVRPDSSRMFTSQMGTVSEKIAKTLNELGGGNEAKPGKLMGIETSVAPGTIQTLISATTGGLGSFVSQVGSSVMAMTGDHKDLKAANIPVLNRFYGEVDEGANIRGAGDRMREIKKLSEQVKAQQKIGLDPVLDSEEQRMIGLANMQEIFQKQQTLMRKEEISIIKDEKLTPAEKVLQRRQIQVERDKLATEVNREYLKSLK